MRNKRHYYNGVHFSMCDRMMSSWQDVPASHWPERRSYGNLNYVKG